MTSAESCPWQGTTTGSGDCWGPPSWKTEVWQGSAGHQDAHGAAMCSCSNAEQRPGLHWELCHSWQREGILSLCSTAVRPALECWAQSWAAQDGTQGQTGQSPAQGHEADGGTAASLPSGEAERAGTAQPGAEQAQGISCLGMKSQGEAAEGTGPGTAPGASGTK